MNHLSETIENHIRAKWPMICFVKPNTTLIEFWFSQGRSLEKSTEGLQFFIQGFDPKLPAQIWSSNSFEKIDIDLLELGDYFSESEMSLGSGSFPDSAEHRQSHEQLIDAGIKAIQDGSISKVVLSRVQEFNTHEVDWLRLFWRLTQVDQNAFRYLLLHPDYGLWSGATPEILISVKNRDFSTMALAGTRWRHEGKFPEWTPKEHEEHQWVVREILQALAPCAKFKQSQITNHRAGALEHLRSDIYGRLDENASVLDLARSLHPTPAVCGFPKNKALRFIQDNEGYERGLYTGYLGLSNPEEKSAEFYVNLRCLRYDHSRFHLYVGGGITKDSIFDHEWQETKRKMTTMGQVIAPFIEQR